MSTNSLFDTIPDDMIIVILKKMSPKEMKAAASISREFYRVERRVIYRKWSYVMITTYTWRNKLKQSVFNK